MDREIYIKPWYIASDHTFTHVAVLAQRQSKSIGTECQLLHSTKSPHLYKLLLFTLWGYWAGSTGTNAMQKSGYELMHDNSQMQFGAIANYIARTVWSSSQHHAK